MHKFSTLAAGRGNFVQYIYSNDMDIKEIFYKNNGFLRTKDLTLRNQWNQLNKMIDIGLVAKLKSGLYCLQQYEGVDQNREVAQIVPLGVFCLFSAWQQYDLTTYHPFEYHIAIERETKILLPDYPPIKIYRWREKFYNLGIVEMDGIKIYDMEKSVCDAIRFRNKVGMDTTVEILQNYVKRKDKNLNQLSRYAQQLEIENIVRNMIMILL